MLNINTNDENRIKELKELIAKYDKQYYENGVSDISDANMTVYMMSTWSLKINIPNFELYLMLRQSVQVQEKKLVLQLLFLSSPTNPPCFQSTAKLKTWNL